MILLVESGSTKTDWALVRKTQEKQKIIKRWQSSGINPTLLDEDALFKSLQTAIRPLQATQPEKVFFYGAGCETPDAQMRVHEFFKQKLPNAKVEIANDLYAAAKACCGQKPGVVCILGTGSSSAYYDGQKIRDSLPGLGYILGDEGSGTYIGRQLLQAFFYHHMPSTLRAAFASWLSPNELQSEAQIRAYVFEQIYRQKQANLYLASLTRFISAHPHPFLDHLLQRSFDDFLHLLQRYPQSSKIPVHFAGSIAWHFRKQLLTSLEKRQLNAGKIIQSPMDEWIKQI